MIILKIYFFSQLKILLYNAINVEQLLKINEKEIENKFPFLQFISRFDNSDINSNFILISNDIIYNFSS